MPYPANYALLTQQPKRTLGLSCRSDAAAVLPQAFARAILAPSRERDVANHLEDLTAEWLEFNGYFVRKSVLVGKRDKGGFEGELDVVGLHPETKHLIHVECSLDADPWPKRELRFAGKFDRGLKYIAPLFQGLDLNAEPDQIALLQLGGGGRTAVGGERIVWVRDFVADTLSVLSTRSPDKMAVPPTLPLIRRMQLAAQARRKLTAQNPPLIPAASPPPDPLPPA